MTELQKAKGQYNEAYENLIPITRQLLQGTGKPFVIENVDSKSVRRYLDEPIRLCGSMFSLGVIRHRLFECNRSVLDKLRAAGKTKETLNAEP